MEPEMRVAFVNSQTACMLAELAGMHAANAGDAQAGRAPTYYVHDFHGLADRFGLGHNTVVTYLMGGH